MAPITLIRPLASNHEHHSNAYHGRNSRVYVAYPRQIHFRPDTQWFDLLIHRHLSCSESPYVPAHLPWDVGVFFL